LFATVLHENHKLVFIPHNVVERNYVLMGKPLKARNLSFDILKSVPSQTVYFLIYFNCNIFMALFIKGRRNYRKGSFADLPNNFVSVDNLITRQKLIKKTIFFCNIFHQ